MQQDRRRLLLSLPPILVASCVPWFAAPAAAAKPQFPAALLIPKDGPQAALGRSMERAAIFAQGQTDRRSLMVFDTAGSPAGAAGAARAARRAGAAVILGPVFADELAAVLEVVRTELPVVTFSNDAALIDRGAFVLGITARQIVSRVLQFAAGRGVRRVAVAVTDDKWGQQAWAAAATAAQASGMTVYPLAAEPLPNLAGSDAGSGDGLPDAVLLTSVPALTAMAQMARDLGVQLLGATPGFDFDADTLSRIDGAWLAAPDPARFASFARAFEERNGSRPGTIAGLAYDAVNIVQQARLSGGTDRSALLAAGGFRAVCGDVRFRDDGSAARAVAVFAATNGAFRSVAGAAVA